jgi:RHH-type proline utilization regulon transcriptional repressor/proline dehydrogenase/delta 1-pyrroline-5-carboxylate dehydrogenase
MTIAKEEIFGPVLAVMKARNFEEALHMANQSAFALTAGIYTRHPRHLQMAAEQLAAGNIYINRPITGAMVGRHPFGGFAMSGGGTKAGGSEYLAHFMFPRVVTENTVRRGFAPAE